MRLRSALVAVVATASLFAPAAFANTFPANPAIQEVSQDADVALWCGSAYVVASQMGGLNAQDSAKANKFAEIAFDRATGILVADGIAEGEHDRLVSYYIEEALRTMQGEITQPRYGDQNCIGLVQ